MRELINYLLFGWYPYVCVTVLIVGSVIRFDREQYTWRSKSSQFLRRRQMMWGSNLFHVGILILLVGHFIGLLTPIGVFDGVGIGHGFKQTMAVVIGTPRRMGSATCETAPSASRASAILRAALLCPSPKAAVTIRIRGVLLIKLGRVYEFLRRRWELMDGKRKALSLSWISLSGVVAPKQCST